MKFFKAILIILLFFSFSCSKKEPKPTVERDYIEAYELLKDKDFSGSAKAFEKIEDDYPFSRWAAKAQTMAAYAYYKNEDFDDVDRIVDDFIRINPSSKFIPYMIYLRGVSYFDRIPDIERAQDSTKKASMIFRELNARFPETDYALDAKIKLVVVDEHLAGAMMSVSRFQQQQRNYVGAIKNLQEVVMRYKRTRQLEEAYFRLFEIYSRLGVEEEANKAYSHLFLKFPNGKWLKKAQKIKKKLQR